VELFKDSKIDFLKLKMYFVPLSILLVAVSLGSLATRGLTYGIDFRGGADLVLRYVAEPRIDDIRKTLNDKGFGGAQIQKLILPDNPGAHDVLIRVPPQEGSDGQTEEMGDVSGEVLAALQSKAESQEAPDKLDLNIVGQVELSNSLVQAFPGRESMASDAATVITTYRDRNKGVFTDIEQARNIPGVNPDVAGWIRDNATIGPYAIRSVDYVGPSVGRELKQRATYAIIGSLIAMLLYIWLRFKSFAFGIAAILTLAHDAIVALGAVSLTGKEFDLTVLAAVLTVVGYSINDTIVIFDRVRENMSLRRGEKLQPLLNTSINQTLSRTILTTVLVLIVVLMLWMFGGSRLNPFSFTLLVGVIIGTYSTIYVSSPLVVWWRQYVQKQATA